MEVPHLLVRFNTAVIKDVPLNKEEISIGRKTDNDVVLDNQAVSGCHCKIRKEGEDYVLVDMASTNGTFINGRKIIRETLKHKDQVRIARYSIEFMWEAKVIEHFAATPPNPDVILEDPVVPPPTSAPALDPTVKEEPPSQIGATLKGDRPLPAASGIIKIISGGEGQTEVRLTELMTYIGTASQAAIKIKGFMAPELAAAISRRPDGYFLKAVKPGYPKVNGIGVSDQIFLESGALIEAGGTNMVFYLDDPKKKGDGK